MQTSALRIILRAMSDLGPLSGPGSVEIEVLEDQRSASEGAFLWVPQSPLARPRARFDLKLVNRYPDGSRSAAYDYFMVERERTDAVCVVLFRRLSELRSGSEPAAVIRSTQQVQVMLRSQLRPPLWFRKEYETPLPADGTGAVQWEVPAGLIESGERDEQGIFQRAQVETLEEVGIELPAARFFTLGHPSSLSPGLIAEKLHFVAAEVRDSDPRQQALGDGHAVEERSISRFVPLHEAMRALEDGLIHDLKTEIALSRLRDHLSQR